MGSHKSCRRRGLAPPVVGATILLISLVASEGTLHLVCRDKIASILFIGFLLPASRTTSYTGHIEVEGDGGSPTTPVANVVEEKKKHIFPSLLFIIVSIILA